MENRTWSCVAEDWRLSQFWYDRETSATVANEVLSLCKDFDSPRVACVACPTLYVYLKKIDPRTAVQLFEFDSRFAQYGSEFTFYDYNQQEEVPVDLNHAFPVIVADPPYLKDRAAELMGLHPCGFRPQHSSKFRNEFRLFANYDLGSRLGGWERERYSCSFIPLTTIPYVGLIFYPARRTRIETIFL